MLLNCCYCPYFRTILKYVHHFANIAKIKDLCSYAPKSRIKAGEAVDNAKYLHCLCGAHGLFNLFAMIF